MTNEKGKKSGLEVTTPEGQETPLNMEKDHGELLLANSGEDQALQHRLASQILLNLHVNSSLFEELGLQFRPNQLDAIQKLQTKLRDPSWNLIGYFVQPTGAGKTVLFGSIARMADVPTIVLVPKTNLLEQTMNEFIEMCGFKREDIGLVGDKHKELGRKVTIATYQSHVSLIKSSPEYQNEFEKKAMVICDEAHKGVGKHTLAALDLSVDVNDEVDEDAYALTESEEKAEHEALKELSEHTANKAFFGFTATPKLSEKHIQNVFGGTEISRESFADLVRARILVPLRLYHTEGNIYRDTDIYANKITLSQEAKILERENTYEKLLNKFVEVQAQEQRQLKTIAYCSTIKECDRFIEMAEKKYGLVCKRVTGDDHKNALKEAEDGLKNGNINIIVTVDKLTEGWNFPPAEAAIVARACGSPARLLQGVGRVVRILLGKQFAHVFETDWRVIQKKRGEERTVELTKNQPNGESKGKNNVGREKRFNLIEAFLANGETLDGLKQICDSLNHEPFDYVPAEKPPEGWLTNTNLADQLGVTPPTIERIAQDIVVDNPDDESISIQNYLDNANRVAPHYNPELIKRIIEKYQNRGEQAPDGWITNKALASELEVDFETVQKAANAYREKEPEWFKSYLNTINRASIHFSPELAEIIRAQLAKKNEAPADWIARRALRTILNRSDRIIDATAKELQASFPNDAKDFRTKGGKDATYYSPDFVARIKEKLNSRGEKAPAGWMNNLQLAQFLDSKRDTTKKYADQYLADHPECGKEYLDERNRTFLYYSPELIEAISPLVKARKKK